MRISPDVIATYRIQKARRSVIVMSRPRNTHDRWALEHNRLKQTWKHRSLAAATATAAATRRTRATQWSTFPEHTTDVSKRGRHHKQRHWARGVLHYGMLGSNRTATTWDSVRSTYECTKSVPRDRRAFCHLLIRTPLRRLNYWTVGAGTVLQQRQQAEDASCRAVALLPARRMRKSVTSHDSGFRARPMPGP